jgi:hypothetical protein
MSPQAACPPGSDFSLRFAPVEMTTVFLRTFRRVNKLFVETPRRSLFWQWAGEFDGIHSIVLIEKINQQM